MANNKCIQSQSKYSFVNFMNDIITQLHKNGQHKTWQHYQATFNSFMRFRQNKDISLRKMDAAMMESYEAYLKQQNVCRNTSSFYMRILRAVYNRAVEQGLVAQQYPFRRVYTGIDKTHKRAVSFDTIKLIQQLNLLPMSVISEGLGHDSETTTQIYLRSISSSEVDKFNAKMLHELK